MVLLLALAMFASACGQIEEPEPMPNPTAAPLRPVGDFYTWNEYIVERITPVTAFESKGNMLYIYPYNDSDKHITIEEFYTSSNHFFDTVIADCSEDNVRVREGYTLFTLSDGVTHAIVPVDEETVLHIYGKLQSGYIDKVAEQF